MKKVILYFEEGGMEDCIEFTDERKFKEWVYASFDNPNLIITRIGD